MFKIEKSWKNAKNNKVLHVFIASVCTLCAICNNTSLGTQRWLEAKISLYLKVNKLNLEF